MANNTLFVIFGMTGSGKSTIIKEMEKRTGLARIKTTTTRPRRGESDNEYNFTTNECFLRYYENYIAPRKYTALLEGEPKDYYYGVDKVFAHNGGLMITDFVGVKDLITAGLNVVGIYLYCDVETRFHRALNRPGFILEEHERREKDDQEKFQLKDIVELGTQNKIYIVDNSGENLSNTFDKVEYIIRNHM